MRSWERCTHESRSVPKEEGLKGCGIPEVSQVMSPKPSHCEDSSMMQRRRSAAPKSGAEPTSGEAKTEGSRGHSEAALASGSGDRKSVQTREEQEGSVNRSKAEEGTLALEDIAPVPPAPEGQPLVLAPQNLQPLFDAESLESLRKADELVKQSPLMAPLAGSPRNGSGWDGGTNGVVVPSSMDSMVVSGGKGPGKTNGVLIPGGGTPQMSGHGFHPGQTPYGPVPMSAGSWEGERLRWLFQQEISQMSLALKGMQEENLRLRMQLVEERETKYTTPPEERKTEVCPCTTTKDEGKPKTQKAIEGSSAKMKKDGSTLRGVDRQGKKDGCTSREVHQQDQKDGCTSREVHQQAKKDGCTSREVHRQGDEDGCTPRGVHQQAQEDGSGDQQGSEGEGTPGWQDLGAQEDGSADQQEIPKEDGPVGRQANKDGGPPSDSSPEEDSEKSSQSEQSSQSSSEIEQPGKPEHRRKKRRSQAMDVMLKLMEGMQHMQQELLRQKDVGRKRGEGYEEETLRGNVELHRLPEWAAESAPVDLQDWLLLIHPQLSDMSQSSAEWWDLTMKTAQEWYRRHQGLKPLEKLQHEIKIPKELTKQKWKRLEKRASSLLLQALPESQKEDILSAKNLTVLGIMTKLLLNYQPGGAHEKATILNGLESPAEATNVAEAISGLRRWLRWKRRSADINVRLPDPTVLLRGLDRLVGKVLAANPTSLFRVNLTRTTLMVDAVPSMKGIEQLAECLLAEFDQMSYSKRKDKSAPLPAPGPKVRKAEEEKKGSYGGPKKSEEERKDVPKCKYFLTEDGCKRGKACKWSHDQRDDAKRCWECGSTKHFSGKCPTKKDSSEAKVAKIGKEKEGEVRKKKKEEEDAQSDKAAIGPGEDMRSLLEEAGRMLKAMPGVSSSDGSSEDSGEARIRSLQKQLDDLKSGSIRVLRLARIQPCEEEMGLVDSGATHALRPVFPGEDLSGYPSVMINLAGGKQIRMKMSPGGVIIGEKDVEPILPMGSMITQLGCSLQWFGSDLLVVHPKRGQLRLHLKEGCPMLERTLTLQLIQELEEAQLAEPKMRSMEACHELKDWLHRLVAEHPALQRLPKNVASKLVEEPKRGHTTGNRSRRKLWKREGGVILYLYSGSKEGYTMARAAKELGTDQRKILAVDIKNGEKWDMINGPLYGELLEMVIQGEVEAVVMSPNCRTRSKLRHYEVPGVNLPGPARQWHGGEWGELNDSEKERVKCWEDDVMMFRGFMLYIVAQEVRKASRKSQDIALVLEHPREPKDLPENVSIWRTPQWKELKRIYGLWESHVEQGELGGSGWKPTTLGGNVHIRVPRVTSSSQARPRQVQGKTREEIVEDSKGLERWAPLLTWSITKALMQRQGVKVNLKSWQTHVRMEHAPFRRDCAVCQEAAARGRPHLRQKLPPRAGVLSIDVAGPFEKSADLGKGYAKFILVATLTWPSGKQSEEKALEDEESEVEDVKEDEDEEYILKEIEDDEVQPEVKAARKKEEGDDEEEDDELEDLTRPPVPDVSYEPSIAPEGGEEVEQPEPVHIKVHRMALPMAGKTQEDALKGLIDIYLMLKADGFQIHQIHSDRGTEFGGKKIEKWCRERCILQTFTAGVDPQANGRAERAVQAVKSEVRKILRAAKAPRSWWPVVVRNLNERWRRMRLGQETKDIPPFLTPLVVRKRYWKTKDLDPKNEPAKYLAPSWLNHGHWVLREDGRQMLTRAFIKNTIEPVDEGVWIALEDSLTPLDLRMRLRGKSIVRRLTAAETPEAGEDRKRREEVLRQEALHVFYDDQEVVIAVLDGTKKLQDFEVPEEEDVLQTKVVSPQDVRKRSEAWREAIEAELHSLMEKTKALVLLSEEETKELEKGEGFFAVPSKCVFTVKPQSGNTKGKKKCRLVACGNFAPAGEEEGECFASGADAISLRLALVYSTERGWTGINLDIRTAFLHAPLEKPCQDEEEEEKAGGKRLLVKPPHILVTLGYFPARRLMEAKRALYGYRRSPKLWSDHRDDEMQGMTVEDMFLQQMDSEPCLWLIKNSSYEEPLGIVVTYVDDLLVLSTEEVAWKWVRRIQEKWETSKPEQVLPGQPTRFLGMELSISADGIWTASQYHYLKDLLTRRLGPNPAKWEKRKIPMVKDEVEDESEEEIEEEVSPAAIKEAQKIVGECIWLVTRCRPDIMYVVSKMSMLSTRKPKKVALMAEQLWRYLAHTVDEGIVFQKSDHMDFVVFTDASFGEEPHGCTIVLWGGAPITWRSSKQGLKSTSTAEAELIEIIEGAVITDSVKVVAEELYGASIRCLQYTDSTSALSIVSGETASWRTRHLRKRAKNIRWRVQRGDVVLRHLPGAHMLADIGTKALASIKLNDLKTGIGMKEVRSSSEEREEAEEMKEAKVSSNVKGAPAAGDLLRVAIALALVKKIKAEDSEEDQDLEAEDINLDWIAFGLAVAIVVITLICERWTFKVFNLFAGPSTQPGPDDYAPTEAALRTMRPQTLPAAESPKKEKKEGSSATSSGEKKEKKEGSSATSSGEKKEKKEGSSATNSGEKREKRGESSATSSGGKKERSSATTKDETVKGSSSSSSQSKTSGVDRSQAVTASGVVAGSSSTASSAAGSEPIFLYGGDQGENPIYITATGRKYHLNSNCHGLRKASIVYRAEICQHCVPNVKGWSIRRRNLYGLPPHREMHTTTAHADATHGTGIYQTLEPCSICA